MIESGGFIPFRKHVRSEFSVAWDSLRTQGAKWEGVEGIAHSGAARSFSHSMDSMCIY